MPKKFTAKASNIIVQATEFASELGHTYIGSEHILLALCAEQDSVASKILERRGVTLKGVKSAVCARIGTGEPTVLSKNALTVRTKRILDSGPAQAEQMEQSYVGTEHILLALLKETESTAFSVLETLGIRPQELENDVISFRGELKSSLPGKCELPKLSGCPTLQKYGKDLTALALSGKLDPVIGRERETERVIKILSRRTKNNPCLIGEPGVGKTAVIEGLAARIASNSVPENLSGKLIVMLDLCAMVAGAKYRGEFEERMKAVLDELAGNPSVIVFIDEIHTLTGTGAAEGAVDAANILKPALARGEIKLIGATTTAEYRRHIEKDAALDRRFGPVKVGEPTSDEAVTILLGLKEKYESHHKVKITDGAVKAAVELSVRYIGEKYLPDKALDLLDEACVSVAMKNYTAPPELKNLVEQLATVRSDKEEAICMQDFENAAALRDKESALCTECEKQMDKWKSKDETEIPTVREEDIAEAVSLVTGIPQSEQKAGERKRLSELADTLKKSVIGQDAAAEALAKAIKRSGIGLGEADRPIGSFIFLGPTGVGKTELCKALAMALFGDRNDMVRIDMSEFSEKHSISKLIGSPPGYVGYGESGILTERVRRKPYSVVLFDEIEKAHPDIMNLLLQLLDEGRLTDSEGRSVNFCNTVVVMTSNIGADKITDTRIKPGFSQDRSDGKKEGAMRALRESFRPEFLNRIDDILFFSPLGKEDLVRICEMMLENVKQKLSALKITLEIDSSVARFITDKSYDPSLGARPLRRAIRTYIEDALTDTLIAGNGISPPAVIYAQVQDSRIAFTCESQKNSSI